MTDVFSLVFFKIIAILLNVVVGFLAGRWLKVERDSIASLLFYFISPIVFFTIPASANLSVSALGITFVTFVICSLLCIFAYHFFGMYWKDQTRNILALSAGNANCGYFMLPIAAGLFDDYTLSIYMMSIVGVSVYESSIGFYISSRSISTTQESIMKVLKLPTLNAFILGCIMSFTGVTLPDFLDDFMYNMRGTYSVLGMVMIGLGLSTLPRFEVDVQFTLAALVSKFLFFPIAIGMFITLDRYVLKFYDENYYNALKLLFMAPMAANTIVIASMTKFHPEKVATTVLISSLFTLIYIPVMVSLFLGDL
jgi:malate permease and related proteins